MDCHFSRARLRRVDSLPFYFVGTAELISTLSTISIGIYALAVLFVLVSILFHALVWFQLLKEVSINLGFKRTLVLYWVGVFVYSLVPGGWSGDLFKAYLLSKDPDIDGGKAVASVVANNVYEVIFNVITLVLGLALLLLNYSLATTILLP